MFDRLEREYCERVRQENLDAMQQMYDEEVENNNKEAQNAEV